MVTRAQRSKGKNRGRIEKTWSGGSYRVGPGTKASRDAFDALRVSDRPCYYGLAREWNALVIRYASNPEAMKILKASDEAKALNMAVTDAETVASKAKAIRAALKRIPAIAALPPAGLSQEEAEP